MGALRTTVVVALVLLAATLSVAAEPLRPLVVDWEQYFRVESRAVTRDGRVLVTGTLWNTTTWGARRIQLLVEGLDAGGQVVNQQVVWLGVNLNAGAHAYFEVPMPVSPSYRVSVFAFDSGRGGRWS
jgi:hypothetical protein